MIKSSEAKGGKRYEFPIVRETSQHNALANQITCARDQRIEVHTLSLMDDSASNIGVTARLHCLRY